MSSINILFLFTPNLIRSDVTFLPLKNEKFLFVVQNGTVYKLDVDTLTVRAQAKLPTTDRGDRGEGGGNRRGGQPPV